MPIASDQESVTKTPQVQFYIAATSSLLERRPRTLKHDDTFAVFDHYGDILHGVNSPEGLFHRDTRYLSRFELQINGVRPLLLSSTVRDNNTLLTVDLTNPDIFEAEQLVLARDLLHVTRSKLLWNAVCHERLAVRNFDARPQRVELSLSFDADFSDIFEIRGHQRLRRGKLSVRTHGRDAARYDYVGLDGVGRSMLIQLDPVPTQLAADHVQFAFELQPGESRSVFAAIHCHDGSVVQSQPARTFFKAFRSAKRAFGRAVLHTTTVESSNAVFNEVLNRSRADLYTLTTQTSTGPYPYAGIPWFSTAFGRDGLITALQMLWLHPRLARGALLFLAERQATEIKPQADAEPGKILHEIRQGEMAVLGEVPFGLYYGSIDSTPLFVLLAGKYLQATDDVETIRRLWPNIQRALHWIDTYGDSDGDGFVEYHRRDPRGLANQGWKDSGDAIFHADGSLAQGPIALCEVQGYVYAAKKAAALIAEQLSDYDTSQRLLGEAQLLATRFEEAFWCEDISMYALALDGNKRPCAVRSSNAGQVLFAGIASAVRARGVMQQLIGRGFFTGWGIRTVASSEARYNPMSYHNGSVWPHDNALIAAGLDRYGFKEAVTTLFSGLFAASTYMDMRRLPELFCGFPRQRGDAPTMYPVACVPQAWSSATPFALLQACLGLEVDALANEIRFRHPRLPDFIDHLILRRVRVGESQVDLMLRRHGVDVAVNLLSRMGDVRVSVTL